MAINDEAFVLLLLWVTSLRARGSSFLFALCRLLLILSVPSVGGNPIRSKCAFFYCLSSISDLLRKGYALLDKVASGYKFGGTRIIFFGTDNAREESPRSIG